MKRTCGILMPIFSLPGAYGIGCFSSKAYEFVDRLKEAGQGCWQILPLGPTGYGNSPYQSFSAFAGNPYFIDPDTLGAEGLLSRETLAELARTFEHGEEQIDYGSVWESRRRVLRQAYLTFLERVDEEGKKGFEEEISRLSPELYTYCLFRAIKDSQGGKSWAEWEPGLRLRDPDALQGFEEAHQDEIRYYCWEQLQFLKQWSRLKQYANRQGIRIIGDMPIYVAADSADAWAHPELFQFDEEARPTAVAGCPPDYFSPDGQLWGNPLYRWDVHRETGYAWWVSRMKSALSLYDLVRVDHFRAFADYYAIPADAKTASEGVWEQGPGLPFFRELKAHVSDHHSELPIIAEDLGLLSDTVRRLVKDSGVPSMKVLSFAFDGDPDNSYLPHNFQRNCVAYTGTHDNEPLMEWIRRQDAATRLYMIRYLGGEHTPEQDLFWVCIRNLLGSVADTVIIPMWDYLGLGEEARINTPSVPSGNWGWRMRDQAFDKDLIWHLDMLASLYSRKRKEPEEPNLPKREEGTEEPA